MKLFGLSYYLTYRRKKTLWNW